MTFYYSPYRRMAAMRHAMNNWCATPMANRGYAEDEMVLALNVQSSDEAYDVTALVPGLTAEDLDIQVSNDSVTIRGEFKFTGEDEENYRLSELPTGKFSRELSLRSHVDPNKVEASIKNGVLSLHIPKAEEDRPKSVKVNVN